MQLTLQFPERTLSTKQQGVIETLNAFLAQHPDNADAPAARRLVAYLLELADVAPQDDIVAPLGYAQSRSLRDWKRRLPVEGLDALRDHPQPGRPAITTDEVIERTVVRQIIGAVMNEHRLPSDDDLAQQVNTYLRQAQPAAPVTVTSRQVQTIRLRWGIQRRGMRSPNSNAPATAAEETLDLGYTRWGGAFVLLAFLLQGALLTAASLLPMPAGFAVTAEQFLLTALFSVLCGIRRAFHLDTVSDVGFALLTGRARPLSHGTFQHILHALPLEAIARFYHSTARSIVAGLGGGLRRVSLDGHVLPRFTRVVKWAKARLLGVGRVFRADELISAFDLDAQQFLALRVRPGGHNLARVLLSLVTALLIHGLGRCGGLRLFFDRGGNQGRVLKALSRLTTLHVYFYTPATRRAAAVAQWEQLSKSDFEPEPFIFARREQALDAHPQPLHLADTSTEIGWGQGRRRETLRLRSIVLHNPQGQTPRERWFVILTSDPETSARTIANEYGDHWRQELAQRVGKDDLCFDIVPPGYRLHSVRDECGELQRLVEPDPKALWLGAWLRMLVFNRLTQLGQVLGGSYARLWPNTLLRLFIEVPAQLRIHQQQRHIMLAPFVHQAALRPLLQELNQKRLAVPWLNGLVLHFELADDQPLYPLQESQKRNRIFERAAVPTPSLNNT